MEPESVPLTEVVIADELPIGSGPVSVICRVKVVAWVAKLMVVLFFTPEKEIVPRAGLPLVVMLVELCGVYVTDTPPPKDTLDEDELMEALLNAPPVE